ncbi:MAG: hypothetical protein AAGC85_05980 [Bacteroidota bacterium]
MKHTKLALISILIITVLAGVPHLFANYLQPNEETHTVVSEENEVSEETNLTEEKSDVKETQPASIYSPLIGTWKASYESAEFTGQILYQFRQEGGKVKAYSVKLTDENGDSMEDNTLAIAISSFENPKGKGIYYIEYEGEKYEIECGLRLSKSGELIISYDYYGYTDTETWQKITQ